MVIPHLRSLWSYILVYGGFLGLATAGIDVSSTAWLLEMWQEESGPLMQGLHFSFAIGSTLSPLLAEPFLSPKNDTSSNSTSHETTTISPEGTVFIQESQIVIPFSIVAGICVLSAFTTFTLYLLKPYKPPVRSLAKSIDRQTSSSSTPSPPPSPSTSSPTATNNPEAAPLVASVFPKSYLLTVILLGALILCFETGIEINSFSYLQTFVVHVDLKLSKSTGAYMVSVIRGSYMISRGLNIFLAAKFNPKFLLMIDFALIAVGNTLLLIFANSDQTMIWIGIILMGFGFSPVYPMVYSFLEERINVTNTVCGFFMFSSALMTIVNPLIEGKFIEEYPLIYVYINIGCLAVCFMTFIWLITTDRTRSKAIGKLT